MRSDQRACIARRSTDLVMLVLLVAGFMKAIDISAFALAMRSWTLFPQWLPLLLAPVVPAVEIALAAAWFLNLWRPHVVAGTIVMLLSFTGVYALHLALGEAPNCGCLGLLEAFRDATHEATVVLTRNGVLLALLFTGVVLRRGGANVAPDRGVEHVAVAPGAR